MGRGKSTTTIVLNKGWWKKPRKATHAPITVVKALPTPFQDSQYYTVKEVAEKLRANLWTIYDYIATGELRAQRLPGGRGKRLLGRTLNEDLARAQCREDADAAIQERSQSEMDGSN